MKKFVLFFSKQQLGSEHSCKSKCFSIENYSETKCTPA